MDVSVWRHDIYSADPKDLEFVSTGTSWRPPERASLDGIASRIIPKRQKPPEAQRDMRSLSGNRQRGRLPRWDQSLLDERESPEEVFPRRNLSDRRHAEGADRPGRHAQRLRNDALASRDWRRTTLRTRCTINYHRWRRRGESERRKTENEREGERALGPIGIGRALGLSVLILKPLSFQLANDVRPTATRYRVISCDYVAERNRMNLFFSLLFSLYDMQICEGDLNFSIDILYLNNCIHIQKD